MTGRHVVCNDPPPCTRTSCRNSETSYIAALREGGLPAAILAKLEPVRGKLYSKDEFRGVFESLLTPVERQAVAHANDYVIRKLGDDVAVVAGPTIGYQANGYLGQFLVVIPRDHLVAVRMMRTPEGYSGEEIDTLSEFPDLVAHLARHP